MNGKKTLALSAIFPSSGLAILTEAAAFFRKISALSTNGHGPFSGGNVLGL